MWSSAETLSLPNGSKIEFCSILNEIIREDKAVAGGEEQLKHAVVVARTMNSFLVSDRENPARQKWPCGPTVAGDHGQSDEKDVTFRGGGLPDDHQTFFVEGKVFRFNMFIATSFRVSG